MKIAILCLSTIILASLAFLTGSCAAPPPAPEPETPPSRGQRDRVMSELHGSRKLLTDVLAVISEEKLAAPGAEGLPSLAEQVAALVEWERTLLANMQASQVSAAAPQPEPTGLSREERQKRNEEQAAAMRARLAGCMENYPATAWKPTATAQLSKAALEQSFREARDATITYARETTHNFARRQVEVPKCAPMDLTDAMMFQAEMTAKLAEALR